MNPARVYIIAEGQTEEAFIKSVLAPALAVRNVFVDARLIGEPGHKGGCVKWQRLLKDIRILLTGDPGAHTTTFFDFFRMGSDFPGDPRKFVGDTASKRRSVELSIMQGLQDSGVTNNSLRRFVPYVQMHEFEALLFSDPVRFAESMFLPDLATSFQQIRNAFGSPEDINNGPATSPSGRIATIHPQYQKVVNGMEAARHIGLAIMRQQCSNFNDWLRRLESVGSQP